MAHQTAPRSTADLSPRRPGLPARCGVRGCGCEDPRQLRNAANAVTVLRTLASLALVTVAAVQHSWPWLLAAYLVYWIGDSADGNIARWRNQETRFGAVFDVVCDRINCVSCALVFLQFVDAPWPIAVFLFQFVVVDLPLTLLPMRWPVLSPNYFHLIDPLAYTLNWHVVAKVTNTTLLITLLVVLPDHQWVALVAASTVLVIKVWSLGRVLRLTVPKDTPHVPQGAAARA
ncbi:CDP-alcohol phosphatidyltransferase family protein [Modestobacter versicolor]|uniref:CDP-diacylglycerol--glycerol-3-phosphate 3-phosphatidyltransferase n=1 Tax=Modestobacter versicolor TaxID=429133 RepID=A0A839YE10_9ACTN|nr:CDP-alcohol phosphatidyltransferase family protein [Modestobacter versicolor]MBB3678003.1 CDP-diacylglycerol--glycerol-3-phosphate 3-phosphatidyltransferase [Modestobacter versicolor]